MIFSISKALLAKALSFVGGAISSRHSHPILTHVRIVADKSAQTVRFTGFDLSIGLSRCVDAVVDESGDVTVPFRLLSDFVGKLDDSAISIEVDDAQLTLTTLTGQYQISTMSSDEYPELPGVEDSGYKLPQKEFVDCLRSVLFSASTDETKQVLTAVNISSKEDAEVLKFGATDGHRLAASKLSIDLGSHPDLNLNLPNRAASEILKLAGSNEQNDFLLQNEDGLLSVSTVDSVLVTRLLDGVFPAYEQLIPCCFEIRINIDRLALLGALERVSVMASRSNNIIKIEIDDQSQLIRLTCEAQDVGNAAENLTCSIIKEGTNDESVQPCHARVVGFNSKYLIESLKNLSSYEVQISLNHSTSPAIFTPLAGGIDVIHLVMPVQIRD